MERDHTTLVNSLDANIVWTAEALNDEYNPYLDEFSRKFFKDGLIAGLQRKKIIFFDKSQHREGAFESGYKIGSIHLCIK